ncbi:MAG: phosphate butyryltransferase [Marinilabiliales bacterium]
MKLKKISDFIDIAKNKPVKKIAVASAEDEDVLEAIKMAINNNIAQPVLVGDEQKINKIADKIGLSLSGIKIYNEPDTQKAAIKAVSLIKEKHADILMKGMLSTSTLLKAVLDKENGLRASKVLSHIAVFESPHYHKLLGVTDAAMNIAPDLDEKAAIVQNAVNAFNKIGIEQPKVAVVCPVETVNPKIESTLHAASLTLMNKRKQIKNCIVDGPLALDNAVSLEAAKHKGIVSDVAGDADILVASDLNSGNILYKSINFLGGGVCAALILGASVPIVLTSRSDSEKSKLLSIAFAANID